MANERLSVVIPTLNEEGAIRDVLANLETQNNVDLDIIVADGGSTDCTVTAAREGKANVVCSAPGRGAQMNMGASAARYDTLLFLHCDSHLPSNELLLEALTVFKQERESGTVYGHFPMEFETEDPVLKKKLRFFEMKTALDRPGTFNGDQGLLILKADFEEIGGFSETFTFLEDQDFGERATGQFITLPGKILTSARRFEQEGFRQRVVLNTLIMGMFHLRLEGFFNKARDIYRQQLAKPRLEPFFKIVFDEIFNEGIWQGLKRSYEIGKYGTQNLWQVMLYWGLSSDREEKMLSIHDQYLSKVVRNPLGYLIGTLIISSWFFVTWLKAGR